MKNIIFSLSGYYSKNLWTSLKQVKLFAYFIGTSTYKKASYLKDFLFYILYLYIELPQLGRGEGLCAALNQF